MKNKTTTTIAALSIFLLASGIAHAQTDTLKIPSVQEKSLAIASRMERNLSLTGSQTRQVIQLALQRFEDLGTENINDATRFETVNKRALPKLAAILTKEQYAKYIELQAEVKKQKEEFLNKNPGYVFSDEDRELAF